MKKAISIINKIVSAFSFKNEQHAKEDFMRRATNVTEVEQYQRQLDGRSSGGGFMGGINGR